ncbi:hypothetical protein CBJ86_000219 [Salmonella enterica subsp. enterica serovar Gateshead]|nr:hypothetical protein [Salmonella enterica subsp. enterica serovar Gateshead]
MNKSLTKFCQRRWRVRLLSQCDSKQSTMSSAGVLRMCRIYGMDTARDLVESLAEGLALKDWQFITGADFAWVDFYQWYRPLRAAYERDADKIWREKITPELVDKIIEQCEAW